MLKKLLVFAAVALMAMSVGCSNGSAPTIPDKANQTSISDYFNSLPAPGPACAKFTYTSPDGKLLASGLLGRNKDGSLYVIQSRGAQDELDLSSVGWIVCFVTYNNPAGTIATGPYSGLPFYYIGQTVDYDINILSMLDINTGNPPYGFDGPAHVHAEQHYAHIDPTGVIVADGTMPGAFAFDWDGEVSYGYQMLNDLYPISDPNTEPGLDVTTVEVSATAFFGDLDIIFFDGIAGVWDPQ